MSEALLIEDDLDEDLHPKVEWLHSQRLVGLLFLSVRRKEEFQILVDRLGSKRIVDYDRSRRIRKIAFKGRTC